jgi:O-antigen/teichoic acid export membrane protein
MNTFWLLLAAMGMMTISLVPHQALYARRQDRAIIVSTLSAFAVAMAANALLVPRMGLAGAATATLCAMSTLALSKAVFSLLPAKKDIPREARASSYDFIANVSCGSGSAGRERAKPAEVIQSNEVTRCG